MEQTLNSQEQQTQKFAIDLLPIHDRNDKFSYITNLSLVTGLTKDKLRALGVPEDGSYAKLKGYVNTYFVQQLNNIGMRGYDDGTDTRDNLRNSGVLFFKAADTKILYDQILITSTNGVKYIGNFEQYQKNGIKTLKLTNEGEINNIINQSKQSQKHTLDNGLLYIKSKQLLNIGADDYCLTDPSKNELCILKDNKIATYIYDEDSIDRQSDYFDLGVYGTIKNIRTDTNNNFYFITCEREGESELRILNRKTLGEVMSFQNIITIEYLSEETGKLFCMDKEGYQRIVTINTKNLPRGYVDGNEITAESAESRVIKIEDKPRSDLKNVLKSGGISLSHSTETLLEESDSFDDKEMRDEIWKTVIDGMDGKTLKELYTDAKTPKEIDIVHQIALQLKKNPHVMAVKGLIDPILTSIATKRDTIRLEHMAKELQDIAKNIATISDFSGLIELKSKLQSFKQERSQILAVDKETDQLLRDIVVVINTKIKEYQEEHQENMVKDIESNCAKLTEYMEGIDYLPQITSVYTTEIRKNTEDMLQYLETEERKNRKKKMADIILARQQFLTRQIREAEKSQLQLQEERINDIKNQITNLKGILESIHEDDALKSMETSDPLVITIKSEIELLPANKGSELLQRLEQIFKERQLSIQFAKETTGLSLKSLDQYGIPKSLYFVPDIVKEVKWEISGKPTKDGLFKLQFLASSGNIIEPSINKKILGNFKFTYSFQEWQDLKNQIKERNTNGIKKKYQELKKDKITNKDEIEKIETKYYVARMLEVMNKISGEENLWKLNTRKNLPSIDNKTVITETIQTSLAKRGRILNQQLQYKQGIMIVESEAGTGKNFKCDILGHLTNREVFDVSCNEYMEKEDLLFSPEIDNDGTLRKPSKLIQGLQTPGAIIVLDEINTLKPGVSKLLNPLLDGRRYINDPQMGRVHAHPSCVIIGLMNPRYYRGTKELPQEFVSRSRMTNDKYPEPKEEAYMISRYLEGGLGKLSQEEFDHYRNEYIQRDQKPADKTVYNMFISLNKVVKVAKKIREVYSKTMKGEGDIGAELNYVFTIRDGNYTIQDFNYTKDIQQSIEDIVLMKIADPEQKEYAKKIIEESCL